MVWSMADEASEYAAQLAAATWAYKTALLLDRAAGGGIVMNDGDPLWFHEHRVPAPNVVLFIGAVRPLASNGMPCGW